MALERKIYSQLINVHQVKGDKAAIIFLKNSEKDFVEGLFYTAKRYGQAEFEFKDKRYLITRNKDFSFTVDENPEQDISTEQFA